MEDRVGLWWHQMVTSWADNRHLDHAVCLQDMERSIGFMFRAGGGSTHVRVAEASSKNSSGPRSWVEKLAGSGLREIRSIIDSDTLALPKMMDVFDSKDLNRSLYLWLAAHSCVMENTGDWVADNRAATSRALQKFPGLRSAHQKLVTAHLKQRPALDSLKGDRLLAESVVQAALKGEDHGEWRVEPKDVRPVWLWMTMMDSGSFADRSSAQQPEYSSMAHAPKREVSKVRRQVRSIDPDTSQNSFLVISKLDSIRTWSEHIRVDRGQDDDPDDQSTGAADDMDQLAISHNQQTRASALKFDLDLPSAAQDDCQLGAGITFPEWNYKLSKLQPSHCSIQILTAENPAPFKPDRMLKKSASSVRRKLEILRAQPRWQSRQAQGDEIDTDDWIRYATERQAGQTVSEVPLVYRARYKLDRSLSTLLMADLSLSTDSYVNNDQRVIDVIRDALYVFAEAISAVNDPFEMCGFSSVRRQHVRIHQIKTFEEGWNDFSMRKVGAIKPGYYTRMGAAIRYATLRLGIRPEKQKLLLLLTDGKPNDLDVYEGRYGIEDTRHAIKEAKEAGVVPFCVTIDEEAKDYMPLLFGSQGFALVRNPQQLSNQLTQAWMNLAQRT